MELNQVQSRVPKAPQKPELQTTLSPTPNTEVKPKPKMQPGSAVTPSNQATVIPRHHATTTPRYRDTTIETVRTAVKGFGKEAATHRFTLEEKKAIRKLVYAYEGRDIRTNENEITRIGVNFLIEDYRINGEHSILHKVLTALNS